MWQPIETAPKDGTEILICTDDGKFYVVSYDDIFSAPWRIRNDEGLNEHVPAHWMSLPEAPNDRVEGRERGILREASSGEAATSTDGLEGNGA